MPQLLLSPQQLYQLLPLVPTMVAWLRHMEPKAVGQRFLQAGADMDRTQQAMRELLNALNFNQGELTGVQLRFIFSCHDVSVWATALRVILAESEPRVVYPDVGTALTATLSTLQDSDETDEIAKVMGAALDQLPRSHFVALGEFCAMLRDTSGEDAVQQIACLVGPMLLAPRVGVVTTLVTSASAAVMEFLIEEAESVFGRVASYSGKKDAMGVRKPPPAMRQMVPASSRAQMVASPRNGSNLGGAASPPPPGLSGGAGSSSNLTGESPGNSATSVSAAPTEAELALARTTKRKNQLRAFFEFRSNNNDRAKDASDNVDALFDNFDFEDIAKGIWERYNMLPPGWQYDLTELRNQGSTKLDWFSEGQVGVQKSATARGRPISFVPAAVAKPSAPKNKIDAIVDEIIDTEATYRDNLEELLQSYLSPIRDICQGRKGPEAAEELGLSAKDVEAIFGWRIGEICRVSALLQKKLEVVALVRTPPKSALGRQGLTAQAFIEIADELHVYAPYVSAHKQSLQTLEKALAAVAAKDNKKGGNAIAGALGSVLVGGRNKDGGKENVNFVKLWEAVSSASPRLRGQTIQSLLILPIQRVPRYKLLIAELLKNTDKEHPAHVLLEQALTQVGESAKQINEALRQHERLGKFFGNELISPAASDGKGNGGRIVQLYVDA